MTDDSCQVSFKDDLHAYVATNDNGTMRKKCANLPILAMLALMIANPAVNICIKRYTFREANFQLKYNILYTLFMYNIFKILLYIKTEIFIQRKRKQLFIKYFN